MMNNPAMKEAMAKVGGADGLADLMKNPQMMAMAQKMMKDPKVLPYSHLFIKCHQGHSCPFLLRMLCGRNMNIKSLNRLLFYYTYFCFTLYIGELLFAEI
jgi:hypothetical protein